MIPLSDYSCLQLPPTENFPRAKIPSTEPVSGEEEEEEHHEPFIRDIMHLQFFWSLAGYGFPSGQVYLLSCCMRKLENNPIVQNCRYTSIRCKVSTFLSPKSLLYNIDIEE